MNDKTITQLPSDLKPLNENEMSNLTGGYCCTDKRRPIRYVRVGNIWYIYWW